MFKILGDSVDVADAANYNWQIYPVQQKQQIQSIQLNSGEDTWIGVERSTTQ